MSILYFSFPNFNIYSTPLLVLALQGLLFSGLLFSRYHKKGNISDLLLGIILLITCYHRTTYTIGFMGWYDTFRNTKINYYLMNLALFMAPLLYFYVKSVTTSDFKFTKKGYYHFIPGLLYFLFKMVVLIYDSNQPGFDEVQNGYLVVNLQWKYIEPILTIFTICQMLLYLAFTFQLYYLYRRNIQHFFSNTYKLELNWIRNFLYIYSFLFIYEVLQIVINLSITELSWKQKWWEQFFSALAIIYIGIKGYFTETIKLTNLNYGNMNAIFHNYILQPEVLQAEKKIESKTQSSDFIIKKERLQNFIENEKPYLDPDLNLVELSKKLNMTRAELSELINEGFRLNFNDFINKYRVDAVKQMLTNGKNQQLSLLGIAYECGFNSKATFNRVFKKVTQTSPTEYLKSMTNPTLL
ncbi:helix-turn-helix domain-containing protein [Aquimarina mytili]|uniref:AraC family transcriptional regulator n=1 Tax=Aquimarina mytili TaxID=874423 RepID=A0A937DA89_9FLAO|nr:helix-turn-helix domain-containing protein [Aquimarina mytili]MBL0682436.1 AraC family transcriptional regulator [Aquimarina mytili]